MKNVFRLTLLLSVVFAGVSCSDSRDDDFIVDYQRSLDAWIRINVPSAIKHSSGIWYEWIEPSNSADPQPASGEWIKVNYTGYSIDGWDPVRHRGRVYMTREQEVARLVMDKGTYDTYAPYTHYTPHYMVYSTSNALMDAQKVMMTEMHLGDRVRMYLTPAQTTASTALTESLTASYGYSGNVSMPTTSPVIIETQLVDIIADPVAHEQGIVREFAGNVMGLTETQSIAPHLYMQITAPGEDPADKITADSTISLRYSGRFIENGDRGFLFDTNIGVVGLAAGRDTTRYAAITYRAADASANTQLIEAFKRAVESNQLTYGCEFTIAFTSTWGYGSSLRAGNATSTYIQPYSPLVFDVKVEPREVEEEEEGE